VIDWDRIVRAHGPAVFGAAWRILGREADAEDVVEEVFRQARELARQGPAPCWESLLRGLAVTCALDQLARRDGSEWAADAAGQLRLALGRLPRREAGAFCLRYFEDLSSDQIAAALHISQPVAAAALRAAQDHLFMLVRRPA
jgi:DNA-directed RNA polymerase specialized sigma24 family protein